MNPLELPLVVGVTSHRNLVAGELEPIRERVREFFALLRRDFPELPLVVISALAEGGDQLVAHEALAAGARLIAPLPLAQHSYAEDFVEGAARAAFNELCERAEVVQMPLAPGYTLEDAAVRGRARDRQYAQAGVYIASHCHVLLALWDGRESELLGGTAQVVRYALDGVMPGLVEQREGAGVALDQLDESIVHHIAVSRADAEGALLAPLPSLQPLQARWLTQKLACAASEGMPPEFHRLFARMQEFALDRRRHADEIRAAASGSGIDAADGADDVLDGLFLAADTLAIRFQRRVLMAMRSIHVLAAATGIAFLWFSELPADVPQRTWGIYLFVLLFGAGALLATIARKRDWHRKYVDYRALAEGLRVQRWWRRAGVLARGTSAFAHDNFMRKQDIELGWIRNVMRTASLDREEGAAVSDDALAAVVADWIGAPGQGGQLDYYTRKTVTLSRTYAATRALGRASLWLGVGLGVLLALFQGRLGADATNLLVALLGVFAIVAAARESYAYRKGDKDLIKQYRYMLGIFANARAKLDAARNAEARREVLRALGEAALAEHSAWALMHRDRPLENTRF